MFNSSPSLADIAAVTGGNRNDGAWGDGGWWVLIILFALFGGWGGYGFGGNGGGGYTATAATQADIQRGKSRYFQTYLYGDQRKPSWQFRGR